MKGQMQIARDYAERNGGDPEYNDGLHTAIVMQTMIDSVRAILDDAAQIVATDPAAAAIWPATTCPQLCAGGFFSCPKSDSADVFQNVTWLSDNVILP